MRISLPKTLKIVFVSVLGLLFTLFVLLSLSVKFFSFPVSVEYILSLVKRSDENAELKEEGSSPFSNLFGSKGSSDDLGNASNVYTALAEKISVESNIPGYSISFSSNAKVELAKYAVSKNFFSEGAIAYTPDPEFFLSTPVEQTPSFDPITASTVTFYLTGDIDSSRISSGTEPEMGLDYFAQNENVKIYISINPEDIEKDKLLVEKTFSGLMYQGIHFSSYAYNSQGRTPEEYSLTPDEFYTSLRSSNPLVSIRSPNKIGMFLRKIGLLREAHAYCVGYRTCPDGSRANCWWDSTWGACVMLWENCNLDPQSSCRWVNPPPPPPSTCGTFGQFCDATHACCDGLSCPSPSGGTCTSGTPAPCVCNEQWSCDNTSTTSDDLTCSSGCERKTFSAPEGMCPTGNDPFYGIQACKLINYCDYCYCAPTCGYSSLATCGTLNVRATGTTTAVSCTSGNVDFRVTNTTGVESAIVHATSSSGGNKTYTLSKIDSTTWGRSNINLGTDVGYGDIALKYIPSNCFGTNNGCTPYSVNVVALPSCPDAASLSVNPACGATTSKATFSWYDYYSATHIQPSGFILRVDRLDPLPSGCTVCDSAHLECCQWMSDNDFYKRVPQGMGTCDWDWTGVFYCTAVLDATTPSKSSIGFKPGTYVGWSVQAVDACGSNVGQCTVSKPGFTCANAAPYCSSTTGIVGSTTIFANQPNQYSVRLYDSADPITYTWSSTCPGTFSAPIGTVISGTNVVTNWTPSYLATADVAGKTCTVSISLSDTALTGGCSRAITVRNPRISGHIYDASKAGGCNPASPDWASIALDSPIISSTSRLKVNRTTPNPALTYTPINTTNGYFSTYMLRFNDYINALFVDNTDLTLPDDTKLEAVCSGGSVGSFSPANLGVYTSPAYRIQSDTIVNIGYRLLSTMDTGWFASINGPIYSKGLVQWVVPAAANSKYASYFNPSSDMHLSNKFAISGGLLNVASSDPDGTDLASSLGQVQNLSSAPSLSKLKFSFKEPSQAEINLFPLITSFAGPNLDPNVIYRADISFINERLANYTNFRNNYGSSFNRDGIVVIYLTGDTDNEALTFTQNLRTNSSRRKFMFVTPGDVVFSPSVGSVTPTGNVSDAEIMASVIAGGDISFPSRIAVTDPSDPAYDPNASDLTITIQGSLLAGGTIDFSRDRRLTNVDPAVAVFFDPNYYIYLQNQINNSPEAFEKIFFSLVSVAWGLD